jgi:ketol-acid reductoisomerase
MGKFLFDKDASLAPLRNKRIGVLGYGNQGRAQALNLRDSGCDVIIGNRRDRYARTAAEDGFDPAPIRKVVPEADILIIAIPDEVQQQVYERHIRSQLRPGQVMNFASSYGIRFECIVPPDDIDVVMMSPRSMGVTVREAYEAGKGVPGFIAVWQDVSGRARQVALALAKAVGCTRAGVFECRFEDESDINLLGEQALWPLFTQALMLTYEVAIEAGIPPEVALIEYVASGETAEIFRQMALDGIVRQARFHSPTSRYGTLTRADKLPNKAMKDRIAKALRGIRNGSFAREWANEQQQDYANLKRLYKQAEDHPINKAEKKVQPIIKAPANYSVHGSS